MNTNSEPKNIGYQELERRFGIKRGTAYALVSRGLIPHLRLGRRYVLFPVIEIEEWLSKYHVSAAPLSGKRSGKCSTPI